MAVTGKTGADAVAKAISHICKVVTAYHVKIYAVIDAAVAASVITPEQATIARTFLDGVDGFCRVWTIIANFSGIN